MAFHNPLQIQAFTQAIYLVRTVAAPELHSCATSTCGQSNAPKSRWSSRGIGQTLVARIVKHANHLDFDSAILIGPLP